MPPPDSAYDAVIFDLDGTLVDSEPLCHAAAVEACAAMGLDVPLAFFQSLIGVDDRTTARLIEERTGATLDVAAFLAEWDRLCGLAYAGGLPVLAGAADLLGRLKAMDLPIGLATSSRRGPAADKLAATGLAHHFRTIVTFDEVVAAKPAPDPYLLAAQRLGVDPARCLAFEDSETGARSARAAGMRVVQVAHAHPGQAPLGAYADHLAPTLLDGARVAGLIALD